MFNQIFHIGNIMLYVMLAISVILLIQKIIFHIVGLFPGKKFSDAKSEHKYAILIPARNESKVIGDLLLSIAEQNYNTDLITTYVIVESLDDPTCEIAKRFKNTNVFVRKNLNLKGKGHALNEVVQNIFSKEEKYEAFFIIDADNVLTPNFIAEMNKTFDAGYDLALGYRNSKNWNDGWVASCSALTFSMLNTFQNKCRARFNQNVLISGTGFYIASHVLEKLGGWDFFTLTEDYELTMFSALNNLKSTYNEYAEYYDEQPKKLKVSWNQRLRWVKGFGQANKKYRKKLIKSLIIDKENRWSKSNFLFSIVPIFVLLVTAFLYAFFTLGLSIYGFIAAEPLAWKVLLAFFMCSFSIYLFFVFYTSIMLYAERKHTNLTFWHKITTALMGPFFMGLYIPLYITAIFKREVNWVPIVHTVTKVDANQSVEVVLMESDSARAVKDDTNSLL